MGKNNVTREFHGDSEEVLAALNELLSGPTFSNADRLQNFLEYVVVETLEGRGDGIRGKTIAQDVYNRSAATDGDPENVVRVDARRLRRRLADYYENEGHDAPIRILIPSGGYVPKFEYWEATREKEERPDIAGTAPTVASTASSSKVLYLLAGGMSVALLFLGLGAGYFLWSPGSAPAPYEADTRSLERQALLDKAPTSLQAVNMAEQTRDLMFPLADAKRQQLALGFFRQAIELDPAYYGGYAGAAQSTAILSGLATDPAEKSRLGSEAERLAKRAVELSPTSPWAQSALGWVLWVNKDFDEGYRYSTRGYEMAPADPYIVAYFVILAVANGDFEQARESSAAFLAMDEGRTLGIRNTNAAANFFLGNYQATIEAYKIAAELGEPISPFNIAIETAALHAVGRIEEARRKLGILQKNWPDLPLDALMRTAFREPIHAEKVLTRLRELGWPSPSTDK